MKLNTFSDDVLLNLLKKDCADALKEIYTRYWKEVLTVYYSKLHDKELAEELTQNLFISLWEKRHLAEIKHLKPYLLGAVKYSILNYYKSLNIKTRHLANYCSAHVHYQENVTEKQILLHDLSAAIEKGIERLPFKTKQVFKLSRIEHQSVKEISSDLNISEKTVEYHITRSVKVLRLYLKEYLLSLLLMLLLLP